MSRFKNNVIQLVQGLLIIFSSIISIDSYSQEKSITKKQMYEDFNFLSNLIEKTNPYIEIKKKYFNYSIIDSIKTYEQEIEKCKNLNDFHLLTFKVMNACIDGHCAVMSPIDWPKINLYIPLMYRGGEYFIKRDFIYESIPFKAGSKLTAINGNYNIHEEIRKQIPNRYLMRWDNQLKLFYSEQFYLSNQYILDGKVELEFDSVLTAKFYFEKPTKLENNISTDLKRVEYFDESKILYIRVPSMNWKDKNYYPNEIHKIGYGKEIKAVVIDVRGNMGGSSLIGRNIMRSILDKPINIKTKIVGKETASLSKRYKRMHHFEKKSLAVPINELDSIDMVCYINRVEEIKPFKKSIKHKGDIYIIGNENIFSAGGAIFMFANYSDTDQIFSIGTPTGWFLGEFTDPIIYSLPNSKIKIKIAPTMSLSGVDEWSDIMLDTYDYTIYPNIDDFKNLYHKGKIFYNKGYLLGVDPYFKPIKLKLK